MNRLPKLLDLRSQNDIELHVKEVEKRGNRIETEKSGYNLAAFDQFKSEILAELKRVKYTDFEDMIDRMEINMTKL